MGIVKMLLQHFLNKREKTKQIREQVYSETWKSVEKFYDDVNKLCYRMAIVPEDDKLYKKNIWKLYEVHLNNIGNLRNMIVENSSKFYYSEKEKQLLDAIKRDGEVIGSICFCEFIEKNPKVASANGIIRDMVIKRQNDIEKNKCDLQDCMQEHSQFTHKIKKIFTFKQKVDE